MAQCTTKSSILQIDATWMGFLETPPPEAVDIATELTNKESIDIVTTGAAAEEGPGRAAAGRRAGVGRRASLGPPTRASTGARACWSREGGSGR